jgi:hypothetical protein
MPVTLAAARAALEVIAAAYYSSETNMPVALPIGPEWFRHSEATGRAIRIASEGQTAHNAFHERKRYRGN